MKARISYEAGGGFETELEFAPRIGDSIFINGEVLKVTNLNFMWHPDRLGVDVQVKLLADAGHVK